jgi:subtilisin family serine protease
MRRGGRSAVAITVAFVCTIGALAAAAKSDAAMPTPANLGSTEYEDGVVLVGFRSGTSNARVADALNAVDASPARVIGRGTRVLEVAPGEVASTIAELRRRLEVRYAEPNRVLRATLTPNDPRYPDLYGIAKISAPAAWDTGTGDGSAVVAVLDTGVDAAHPDLNANAWRNPGGIFGCAAGTNGWDAINSDCNPTDDHNHGAHVSGTIGAAGNNGLGLAGVNWDVGLMGLKVLDRFGYGSDESVIAGIDRAVAAKQAGVNVRVLSASLGAAGHSTAMREAVERAIAAGIVFVAAAGNSNANVDVSPFSPCVYATICVAATASNDTRASFSNYGTSTVDLAAPGVSIVSTAPGNQYRTASGTSMATPHVSGALALLAQTGACRTWPAPALASLVLTSADTVAASRSPAIGGSTSGARWRRARTRPTSSCTRARPRQRSASVTLRRSK